MFLLTSDRRKLYAAAFARNEPIDRDRKTDRFLPLKEKKGYPAPVFRGLPTKKIDRKNRRRKKRPSKVIDTSNLQVRKYQGQKHGRPDDRKTAKRPFAAASYNCKLRRRKNSRNVPQLQISGSQGRSPKPPEADATRRRRDDAQESAGWVPA